MGVSAGSVFSSSCPFPLRVEEVAEPLPSEVLAPEELKPVGWEPEVPLPGEYPLNQGPSWGSWHSCCRQHPVIQLAEGRTL